MTQRSIAGRIIRLERADDGSRSIERAVLRLALASLARWIASGYMRQALPKSESRRLEIRYAASHVLEGNIVRALIAEGSTPRSLTSDAMLAAIGKYDWDNPTPPVPPEWCGPGDDPTLWHKAKDAPDDLPEPWAELEAKTLAAIHRPEYDDELPPTEFL